MDHNNLVYNYVKLFATKNQKSIADVLQENKYNTLIKENCFKLLSKSNLNEDTLNNCFNKVNDALEIKDSIYRKIDVQLLL